ncbi:MAG: hypothetical protein CML07_01240 [Psychrobacter sp.]|nr:hypothetical protein [Psychrobacter sp.]
MTKEHNKIDNFISLGSTRRKFYCPNCKSKNVDSEVEPDDEDKIIQCVCIDCEEFWYEEPDEDI